MRIWGKLWKNNHLLKDQVVTLDEPDTRTHKVMQALEAICMDFDLPQPIWLPNNIREFQRFSRVRFRADSFIEEIEFDYLEIQVLDEDFY